MSNFYNMLINNIQYNYVMPAKNRHLLKPF
jgi:hypothetical protein